MRVWIWKGGSGLYDGDGCVLISDWLHSDDCIVHLREQASCWKVQYAPRLFCGEWREAATRCVIVELIISCFPSHSSTNQLDLWIYKASHFSAFPEYKPFWNGKSIIPAGMSTPNHNAISHWFIATHCVADRISYCLSRNRRNEGTMPEDSVIQGHIEKVCILCERND